MTTQVRGLIVLEKAPKALLAPPKAIPRACTRARMAVRRGNMKYLLGNAQSILMCHSQHTLLGATVASKAQVAGQSAATNRSAGLRNLSQ